MFMRAAQRLENACSALGGAKNHMIIMPDAEMSQAVDALIGAGYGSAGERCMAVSVAVPVGEATARKLVKRLIPRVENLKIGPSPRFRLAWLASMSRSRCHSPLHVRWLETLGVWRSQSARPGRGAFLYHDQGRKLPLAERFEGGASFKIPIMSGQNLARCTVLCDHDGMSMRVSL